MAYDRRGHRVCNVLTGSRPLTWSEDYFKAPIDALSDSLKVDKHGELALHDITDAYSVFTDRIRCFLSSDDLATAESAPALGYMRSHTHVVLASIIRDINCAAESESFNNDSADGTGPSTLDAFHRHEFLPSETRHHSRVAHHAIQLLSCIFGIPILSDIFSEQGRRALLTPLLKILQGHSTAVYNAEKTRSLAMWVLSTQRLPTEVLNSYKDDIVAVLRIVLREDNAADHLLGDCLKTLHNLLTSHPSLFFVSASELLQLVLQHLVSPTRILRLRAAYALAGFTHASIWSHGLPASEANTMKARNHIHECVCEFAKLQSVRSKPPSTETNPTLRDLLATAMPETNTAACGPDVPWAFSVVGSLTVLAEGYIFTSPPLLKMVVQCLPKARSHDWKSLRSLHSFVWRCLIWAFTRTPCVRNCPPSDDPSETAEKNFRRRALSVVRQDGRPGVRSSLVYALLGMDSMTTNPFPPVRPEGDGIHDVFLVIQDLVTSSSNTLFNEGITLLRRLTSAVGSSEQYTTLGHDSRRILPVTLLDGSLVAAQPRDLNRIVHKMTDFDTDSVGPFTETEVDTYWERLLFAWELSIKRAVKEDIDLTLRGELLTVWQSLLLAKTQLAQTQEHLTAVPEFAARTIGIVKDLIEDHSTEDNELRCLETALKLWKAMELVFSRSWISEASNNLINVVLIAHREKCERDVCDKLEEFCIDFFSSCSPDILVSFDSMTLDTDYRRRLWNLAAKRWKDAERTWNDTAVFLSVPPRCWTMSKPERDTWTELFDLATASASASGGSADDVLEVLFQQHLPNPIPTELIPLFINYLSLNGDHHVPTTTLKHLNNFLLSHTAPDLHPVLCIFDVLSARINSCSPSVVLPTLRILSEGLCSWVSAGKGIVSQDDYESKIAKFYCIATQKLAKLPHLPEDTLIVLEDFLSSLFEHYRSPACVTALKDLCEVLWRKTQNFDDVFPGNMKLNLTAWYDVCKDIRPEFLPAPSQSQWTDLVDVPASQAEEVVETSFIGEMPLPLIGDDTVTAGGEAHVERAAQSKEPDSAQRHILSDSLRINRGLEDKTRGSVESGADKGQIVSFDTSTSRPLSLENQRDPVIVLGKRAAATDPPDAIGERKRHRTARSTHHNWERRHIHTNTMSSENNDMPNESAPEVATTKPEQKARWVFDGIELPTTRGIQRMSSPDVGPEQTSLPSPPYSSEAEVSRSVSAEGEYEGSTASSDGQDRPESDSSYVFQREQTNPIDTKSDDDLDLIQAKSTPATPEVDTDLPRARATSRSASLHMIMEAYEALMEDAEMPVDDVLSAQEIIQEMDSVLTGKLKRRLNKART